MATATQAQAAGVRGEAEKKLLEEVRKHVRAGRKDADIVGLLKEKEGLDVSLYMVRKIRKKALGISKPGGSMNGHGRRKKPKKAKPHARRKPAAKAQKKPRRKASSKSGVRAVMNGAAPYLKAALQKIMTKAVESQRQARLYGAQAKLLGAQAKKLRRVIRTLS